MDTDHALSLLSLRPSLKKELSPNINKSPTFAVKRRTFFTAPVHNYIAGKACWRVAASRNEFSAAALLRQENSQPIADAKINH